MYILSPRCKSEVSPPEPQLVKNKPPVWGARKEGSLFLLNRVLALMCTLLLRTFSGCGHLVHLEADSLNCLRWPSTYSAKKYFDHSSAPLDCGFVACLANLKELKVLITEVGGRAVEVRVIQDELF